MKLTYRCLRLGIVLLALAALFACVDKDTPETPKDDNTEQPTPDPDPNPDPDPDPDPEPNPDPDPDPSLPNNYLLYGDEVTELRSMCYIVNDVGDLGKQYALAMTPTEGIELFDDIIQHEEYIFLSLGENTLFEALESNGGHIDVMDIDSSDVVYMFIAKVKDLDIEDNANSHLNIVSGEVVVELNTESRDITICARYNTVVGDVEVVATLPLEEPAPVDADSYIRYTWNDVEVVTPVGSAYVEQTSEGVVYTICKDSIKSYVYYEDTPFLKVVVEDKDLGEDFELDVTSYAGRFSIWACDPIKGMDLRISDDSRESCSGSISVKEGVFTCTDLYYDAPSGEQDDVHVDVCFADEYRTVNECVSIIYDEREELFTPRSVVLDNSDDSEYKIYVSSRAGVTSVKDMVNAEVVLTYPAEGWDKWLMKGNFISGSSYPTMTFQYKRSKYIKGEGDCYGMNGQFPEYDAEEGDMRLNLNLYTEEGGIALYYSGAFTLVE